MILRILILIAVIGIGNSSAHAEGDPMAGEKAFRKCKSCHDVTQSSRRRAGPNLAGVVGSAIASDDSFAYSKAFVAKKAEGLIWSAETLELYLAAPRTYIPGTKKTTKVAKPADRANLIAYLAEQVN